MSSDEDDHAAKRARHEEAGARSTRPSRSTRANVSYVEDDKAFEARLRAVTAPKPARKSGRPRKAAALSDDEDDGFDDDEDEVPVTTSAPKAAPATTSEGGGGDDDESWRTEGSDLLFKRVQRSIYDEQDDGTRVFEGFSCGTVVGWLDAHESDFMDDGGSPAALYRVAYEDGQLQGDVEVHAPIA